MSKPTTYSYAMTLRLDSQMESELADLAYSLRLSKASTIRRSLRRAIVDHRFAAGMRAEPQGTWRLVSPENSL